MATKIREHDGLGMGADEVPYFLPQSIADMDESLELEFEFEIVVVASKTCGPDEKDAVQKEATRRLRIALASTELLEALESFLRAPSVGSDGPGSSTIVVQEFNRRSARKAIAKARGE